MCPLLILKHSTFPVCLLGFTWCAYKSDIVIRELRLLHVFSALLTDHWWSCSVCVCFVLGNVYYNIYSFIIEKYSLLILLTQCVLDSRSSASPWGNITILLSSFAASEKQFIYDLVCVGSSHFLGLSVTHSRGLRLQQTLSLSWKIVKKEESSQLLVCSRRLFTLSVTSC